MFAGGLNAQGLDVGGGLNPFYGSPFDPSTPPSKTVADPAGIVRTDAAAAGVTSAEAAGAGIVQADARQAGVSTTMADGAGIVRTSAKQSET